MKRLISLALAIILLLSFSACGRILPQPTEQTPELLAGAYVQMLKSGSYQYSYIVPYEGIEMTATDAAKDGVSVYKVSMDSKSSRIIHRDGKYYAVDDTSGVAVETTADKNLGGELDFGAMTYTGSEEREGKTFETYSMRRNDQPREFTFVFENGALIGLAFSYMEDAAPYFAVTEFTGVVDETLFELPEKTTLAIGEIEEGTYTGTLEGTTYTNSTGTMTPTISPAELSVTIQGGNITLYCESTVSAEGEIEGVQTPHSPEYTIIVSGSLPLQQSDASEVSAQGDVAMLGETMTLCYDAGQFTEWKVGKRDEGSTFACTVSITMKDGIPTADITVDSKRTHQTATVPLRLKIASP